MIRRRQYAYIAAGMGTGKSLATLLGLLEQRRILVACPLAVGDAWVKQVGLHDTDRDTVLLTVGTSQQRASILSDVDAESRIAAIVNYDAVARDTAIAKAIRARPWDAIVLDESHRVKSPTGRASKFFRDLAKANPAAKRICLSGTPTPRDPLDWWAQFRFLDADVLGDNYHAFRARIAVPHPFIRGAITGFRHDAVAAMAKRIDPHVYRITTDSVISLPGEIHTQIPVRLHPSAAAYYSQFERDMIATVATGETVTAANKLVVVTRLQQATSGFGVDVRGNAVAVCSENAKQRSLADLLEDLDEPVVIFCKFRHDLEVAASVCKSLGKSWSELSGSSKQLSEWQEGATSVLIVQQQSGGCGIDLTRSAAAIYFSLSHSLGDYEQSLARLRRPGQTRTVRYWHLVATGTVDESIYAALDNKRDVADEVYRRLTRRKESIDASDD
jgi:SNF2 family DNA or RNA helicase